MVDIEKVRELRINMIDNLSEIDKKTQHGIEIYMEFDYLLNVDIDWIIKEIRKSIFLAFNLKPIRHEHLLTFRIRHVSTEHCIVLGIFIGIVTTAVGGLVKDYLKDLIDKGYEKLKERVDNGKININRKDNLKQVTLQPIIYEKGQIKNDNNKKPIVIKRNDDNPKWVRF